MTLPDPRWGDVVRLQQQFMTAASPSELRIQASIDFIVAAIAGGKPTDPDAPRRAADSAERRDRNRRRLLRDHVHAHTEALRCACDYDREQTEVARDTARRAMAVIGDLDAAIVVAIGEGETAAAVAKTTGLSVVAVRQRACRARARVRKLLAA